MVEIVFPPPNAILYLVLAIVAVGVVSVFIRKGDTTRKVTGLVLVVLVAGGMLLLLYRKTTLTLDEEGVRATGRNGIEATWDEILSAVYEPNLPVSPYRPTVRSSGAALGDYRFGKFLLSNGDEARVLMERQDQAVVFVTEGLTYLYSPADIQALVDAVNLFRPLGASGQ